MARSDRRRSSSSSSSEEESRKKKTRSRKRDSSDSSDDGQSFESNLEKERLEKRRLKKEKKLRKKELETPEEKRARRLAKKLKKDAKRKMENKTYLPPEIAYTNDNNPFNDVKLTETFVWGKKLEKEGKATMSKEDIDKDTRRRVEKNMYEMTELKRARDARRAAKEDMEMIQRDLDRKAHGEWTVKEAEFQLNQAKIRSKLRIEQNRAKPIDLLSRYIQFGDDNRKEDYDFELDDPLTFIKGLSMEDYEDLIEDIKVYIKLEGNCHISFWKDVRIIVDDEVRKIQNENSRKAVHGSVNKDVIKIMKDKSMADLEKLEQQVASKISNGSSGVDVSYWEEIYDQLVVHIAKVRLKELHQKMLKLKLQQIREEQMKQMAEAEKIGQTKPSTSRPFVKKEEGVEETEEEMQKQVRKKVDIDDLESIELNEAQKEAKWRALTPERLNEAAIELYERGSYSPTYGAINDTMPGIEILDESEDAKSLLERRQKNRKAPEGASELDAAMLAIARKGMDGSEATFSVEANIAVHDYLWSDKYRPRKPTYLNRVMTGFDWNKYNQTHYDMDNPPPKIVQGYKFNIFYPDLLDKKKTPSYQVLETDDPDFTEIRFHAGAPYEDIAFKIVNREWEVNYKNGFKCQFHNGVFQLWFTFKKYRYRR